jgi:ribosomal protein S27AE
MWGKTHNEEAKLKIIEANKQKVVCPHCGKTGGIAVMKRWHFGNCKVLTQ